MKNNNVTRYNDSDTSGGWLKNFFDFPFVNSNGTMKTNISKSGDNYLYDINVAGYDKENISVTYEDSYLVVRVSTSDSSIDYIREEKYYGSSSRSFYVGDIDDTKITASYKNGILSVLVPSENNKQNNEIKKISIK